MNEINFLKTNSDKFLLNTINEDDGLELLRSLQDNSVQLVIFDPQYEKVKKVTMIHRSASDYTQYHEYPLIEQSDQQIEEFCQQIQRVLKPNAFLLFWINKSILLANTWSKWLPINLKVKEVLIWDKNWLGLGWWPFRNQVEYCLFIQKSPYQIKSNHKIKGIGNVWKHCIGLVNRQHVHLKPYEMIRDLINQLTQEGDLVVDPCAGSFVSLSACQKLQRNFLGTDLTFRQLMQFNINKKRSRELLKQIK